jgi:ectoine hydroxylase-related dioxygenase (phytanoyl-CoA dioxygenase family)
MKSPFIGSPVQWHQDWAFYPHTNDDVLAVGVCIDEMTVENGSLLVIPESHTGPILDHHQNGKFCGAVTEPAFNGKKSIPLELSAGGITIHHARLLHGSGENNSDKSRRLLLFQYSSSDAWPLIPQFKENSWNVYKKNLLRGTILNQPRLENVPVRLPYPAAERTGSIYESQSILKSRYFN